MIRNGKDTEVGRLERVGSWWWPKPGFELLIDESRAAVIKETGGLSSGSFRMYLADSEIRIGRENGEYAFALEDGAPVARLREVVPRSGQPTYDLEIMGGIEPVPILATCVVIDLMRRRPNG